MRKVVLLVILFNFIISLNLLAQDTDSDGLDDSIEITLGTDELDSDTDNDGILDGDEDANHNGTIEASETNPLDADTDDDGISDGEEITFLLDPLDSDTDNDGLNDGLEIGRTTKISNGESDESEVPFLGTAAFWVPDSDPATITDPLDPDSDNDGLSDGPLDVTSVCIGGEDLNSDGSDIGETSPLDADTDDDGLADGNEDLDGNGFIGGMETDALNSDTDSDGLNDGLEKGTTSSLSSGTSDGAYALNRVSYLGTTGWTPDADEGSVTDAKDSDTDNDGILDGIEDADHDGLQDVSETDPLDADTDDDGISDGDEDEDYDGVVDANETDPLDEDTDNDKLNDGLENGLTTGVFTGNSDIFSIPYQGTNGTWTADSDPTTITNPLLADTDDDGIIDGDEDADKDGRRDASETDPNNPDTDGDGSEDGDDCSNLNPDIYPEAEELCDGIDNNCDGIIFDDSENSIVVSACDTYTAPDGQDYTTSGTKIAVIPNNCGCDSTITIDLTINTVDVSTSLDNNTITANETDASYQWIDCADNSFIESETNNTYTALENGSYAVIVSKYECVDTSDCVTITLNNIQENELSNNIKLYPNPTTGKLHVNLKKLYDDITINILDVSGKVIQELSYNSVMHIEFTLDERKGIYFIEIISDNNKAVLKIIKQ